MKILKYYFWCRDKARQRFKIIENDLDNIKEFHNVLITQLNKTDRWSHIFFLSRRSSTQFIVSREPFRQLFYSVEKILEVELQAFFLSRNISTIMYRYWILSGVFSTQINTLELFGVIPFVEIVPDKVCNLSRMISTKSVRFETFWA